MPDSLETTDVEYLYNKIQKKIFVILISKTQIQILENKRHTLQNVPTIK